MVICDKEQVIASSIFTWHVEIGRPSMPLKRAPVYIHYGETLGCVTHFNNDETRNRKELLLFSKRENIETLLRNYAIKI